MDRDREEPKLFIIFGGQGRAETMGAGGRRDVPGVSAAKLSYPFILPPSHFYLLQHQTPAFPAPTQGWAALSSMMGLGRRLSGPWAWPHVTQCLELMSCETRAMVLRISFQDQPLAHLQPLMNKNSIRTLVLEMQLFQDSLLERQGISFSRIKLCICQYSNSIWPLSLGVSFFGILHQKALLFEARLAVGSHASGWSREILWLPLEHFLRSLFGTAASPTDSRGSLCESSSVLSTEPLAHVTSQFSSPVLWMWHSVPRPDFCDVEKYTKYALPQ